MNGEGMVQRLKSLRGAIVVLCTVVVVAWGAWLSIVLAKNGGLEQRGSRIAGTSETGARTASASMQSILPVSEAESEASKWLTLRMDLPLGIGLRDLESLIPSLGSSLGIDFSNPSELPSFKTGLLSEELDPGDDSSKYRFTFYSIIDAKLEGKSLVLFLDESLGLDYVRHYLRLLKEKYGCPKRVNFKQIGNCGSRAMVLIYSSDEQYRLATINIVDSVCEPGNISSVNWQEFSSRQAKREPKSIEDTFPVDNQCDPNEFLTDVGIGSADICL